MPDNVKFVLSCSPADNAASEIIKNLWQHNEQYAPVNMKNFMISATYNNETIAGLVTRTWWGTLDIQYLWVMEPFRGKGTGRKLMLLAEEEAKKEKCRMATVDTFSCQAPGFYQKLGYSEYGSLSGYAEKYTRHYLSKLL